MIQKTRIFKGGWTMFVKGHDEDEEDMKSWILEDFLPLKYALGKSQAKSLKVISMSRFGNSNDLEALLEGPPDVINIVCN